MSRKTIYDPVYRSLLGKLRGSRIRSGLTQAEVGRRLGKGHAWCQKVEAGELRLDTLHYVMLCRALGVCATRFIREMQRELQDEDGALLAIGEFGHRHISTSFPLASAGTQ